MNVYEQAAMLYEKEGKFFEASVIYEYLFFDKPEHQPYKQKLIFLFEQLGHTTKVTFYANK